MRAIGLGIALMLGGLGALFAMVVRVVAPSLVSALAAFAALFAGMLIALLHAGTRSRGR